MRVALVVLAGCWTEIAAPPPAPPASVAASAQGPGFPLHSVWRGTYRCLQGLSAVTLTIDADPDGHAVARYDFGPVETNPDVPTGAFELAGTLRGERGGFAGSFEPTQWIEQPDRYFMVGLAIETAGRRRLRGEIDHETCSDFEAERID